MHNNPFRQKPGSCSKYKEQSSGGKWKTGSSNNNYAFSKKEREWGKTKFTPVVRIQAATPWATFKNEIIQKQHEETKASKNLNMESEEAKQFLKKREENFRRMQMIEAKKEDVLWEDFSEPVRCRENGNQTKKSEKFCSERSQPNIKMPSKPNRSKKPVPLVDNSLLRNFDSKKLSFKQNNTLRRVITKTTNFARGSTLEAVVKDLKRCGVKRKQPKRD
ncbi:PREDICTED: uncharacterized protein LOC108360757 [Rhagoletis zephyria]|uniref:uncharacterized protein LOC108360757 n=1 Tax=Rhagoletis zephyria TaxID=28612 RepID=UPI0008116479|nr:PREDICTED: uncharacterized protein LOC108360757 [Rhagoletis zephyria]